MRTWRFGLLLHTCRKDMVSGADVVRTCLREAQTTSSHDIARARHETQHYHKITKPCRPSVGASAWLGPQEKKMSNWFACLFQIRNRRKKNSSWPYKLMQFCCNCCWICFELWQNEKLSLYFDTNQNKIFKSTNKITWLSWSKKDHYYHTHLSYKLDSMAYDSHILNILQQNWIHSDKKDITEKPWLL